MNKKLRRLTLLFLCAAIALPLIMLIPMMSSGADEGRIYFNRTFDERSGNGDLVYPDAQGMSAMKAGHAVKTEANGNRYYTIQPAATSGDNNNPFCDIYPDTDKHTDGCVVFEIDLKFDSTAIQKNGVILYYRPNGGTSANDKALLETSYSSVTKKYTLKSLGTTIYTSTASDTWVHFAFVVNTAAATKRVTAYVNGEQKANNSYTLRGDTGSFNYIRGFRINVQGGTSTSQILKFDNVKLYAGSAPRDIGENPGILVDPDYKVTIAMKNALVMKVGCLRAALHGDSVLMGEESAAPVKADGTCYIPLVYTARAFGKTASCTATEITVGGVKTPISSLRHSPVTAGNVTLVSVEDAEALTGLSIKPDATGIITVMSGENTLTRDICGTSGITRLAEAFVYEFPSGDKVLSDIEKKLGSLDVHPRLQADADRFAQLRSIYKGYTETGAPVQDWIDYYVRRAATYRDTYFQKVGASIYWKSGKYMYQPYYVYETVDGKLQPIEGKEGTDMYGKTSYGNGYDVGGRSRLADFTTPLKYFGFAYQITGDESYADYFYEIAKALGEWKHWGEGHFLNNADGAVLYATGFDWIWHAFDSDADGGEARRGEIAQILFEKAIFPGYGQFRNIKTSVSPRASGGWNWSTKVNNWVSVCGSGIMTSCLAIAEYSDLEYSFGGVTYSSGDVIKTTIADILKDTRDCMEAYVPDGAYAESPGYWGYGTNTLFVMIENLMSTAGSSYGYSDAVGMDNTCEYALKIESPDGKYWNYHDSGSGNMATHHFSFAGKLYNKASLITIRYSQIEAGKSYGFEDILYYDDSCYGGAAQMPDPDAYFEGIDTFVTRSSWSRGGIFTGLHAGPNYTLHGNYDSGNFVIYKDGVEWICDLGSDNYNLRSYFMNASYYRLSPEGANTIVISGKGDMTSGQLLRGESKTVRYESGDCGALSVVDMSGVYGKYVSSAKRGMLFTNSRETIVVQDEIELTESSELWWFAHTKVARGSITFSDDRRTAYLRSGGTVLRASIVGGEGLAFTEVMDTYTTVCDGTFTEEESIAYCDAVAQNKGQREYDRSAFSKLAIHMENVRSAKFAVVFEFTNLLFTEPGYSYTPMDMWEISDGDERLAKILTSSPYGMAEEVERTGDAGVLSSLISYYTGFISTERAERLMPATSRYLAEHVLDTAKKKLDYLTCSAAVDAERDIAASRYKNLTYVINEPFTNSLLIKTANGTGTLSHGIKDGYYDIRSSGTVSNNFYFKESGIRASGSYVLEFDLRTDATLLRGTIYQRYTFKSDGVTKNDNAAALSTSNFAFSDNSIVLTDENGVSESYGAELFSLKKWVHVAYVLHITDSAGNKVNTADLYLDGTLVRSGISTKDITYPNAGTFEYRISISTGANIGSTMLDNLKIYSSDIPLNIERAYTSLYGSAKNATTLAGLSYALSRAKELRMTGKLPTALIREYATDFADMEAAYNASVTYLSYIATVKDTAKTTAQRLSAASSALSLSDEVFAQAKEVSAGTAELRALLFTLVFGDVKISAAPERGLILKISVPQSAGAPALTFPDGTAIEFTLSGGYYTAEYAMQAASADTTLTLTLRKSADGEDILLKVPVSLPALLGELARDGESERVRRSAAAALAYIRAVYTLYSSDCPAVNAEIISTPAAYSSADALPDGIDTSRTVSGIRTVFSEGHLDLSGVPEFIFTLRSPFTGSVTISYADTETGKTVNEVFELSGSEQRITLRIPLASAGGKLTITAVRQDGARYTGVYSLGGYAGSIAEEPAYAAVLALANYIAGAKSRG